MVKDHGKERKMSLSVVQNYATELKLVLAAVLFLCSITTFFHLFPSGLSFSVANFHSCVSTTTTYREPVLPKPLVEVVQEELATTPPPRAGLPPPSKQAVAHDEVLEGGLIIKRAFNPYGTAAYNYILMAAYRGGLDTFAVVGLASKPLHTFGQPIYQCEWLPHPSATTLQQHPPITTVGFPFRPDWNLGRVYSVVVVNCTFPVPVGIDPAGGTLLMHASTNGVGDRNFNLTDTIEGLTEAPGSLNLAQFTDPPKYDYLYCGSCLFGDLNPQRIREWLAYHIKLFGPRSHFVLHNADGLHPDVMKVLRPWMEKGYITLEDIRETERFNGVYHNQFLVLNDCLFRYRLMAKWMFFFDVDEFIYVASSTSIVSVMDSLSNYTHVTFEQMPMSDKLCHSSSADMGELMNSKWGFEKLVYRDTKRGVQYQKDRKYAVRPRSILVTGVHRSDSIVGMRTDDTGGRIVYFHYHKTINRGQRLCQQLILNATETTTEIDGITYALDTRMQETAESVKKFELEMIGPVLLQLQSTPLY